MEYIKQAARTQELDDHAVRTSVEAMLAATA